MSMIKIKWEFRGIEDVTRSLFHAERRLDDFKVPLERCGIEMYKSIDKNFQAQGRPQAWVPHAPLTRKLRGGGGKILQDSGKLRQSVTAKGASGSKYKLSKNRLIIGSNLKARGSGRLLGEIQQYGQPAGVHKVFGKPSKHGMPARPFMMIQPEDEERFEKIFKDYVEEIFK